MELSVCMAFDSPFLEIRKAGWIFHHHGSVIGIFSPQILASSSDGVNAITLLFEKSLTFLVMI